MSRAFVSPTLLAVLAALAWTSDAPAGPPEPTAAASAPTLPAPTDGTPTLRLADGPVPSEKSPPPKATEWVSAPIVALTRTGPAVGARRARLIREWMRIRCVGKVFAISLLAGTPEGIAFWIGGTETDPFGEILMPIRSGDRRVFQLWMPGQDEAGAFVPKPMLVVQEHWAPSEKAPVVTAW